MKEEPVAVEKESEEIKARYSRCSGCETDGGWQASE